MSSVNTNGFCYWRPSYDEQVPPKEFPYQHPYKWVHLPTGGSGISSIWTSSKTYPQHLIDYWDATLPKEWHYEKADYHEM